jgi:hypothetical protein
MAWVNYRLDKMKDGKYCLRRWKGIKDWFWGVGMPPKSRLPSDPSSVRARRSDAISRRMLLRFERDRAWREL